MAFLSSGANFASNWTTNRGSGGSASGTTTGYKESGTDMSNKTGCSPNPCHVRPNPICESFPSTYKRNGALITENYWTNVCIN